MGYRAQAAFFAPASVSQARLEIASFDPGEVARLVLVVALDQRADLLREIGAAGGVVAAVRELLVAAHRQEGAAVALAHDRREALDEEAFDVAPRRRLAAEAADRLAQIAHVPLVILPELAEPIADFRGLAGVDGACRPGWR